MSKLRKKIQQARHEYQHQRYPGDLADELLGRADVVAEVTPTGKPSYWGWKLSLAAAVAVVATAGLVLFKANNKTVTQELAILTPTTVIETPTPATNPAQSNTQSTQTTPVSTDSNDGGAEVEERLSLVPSQVATAQETSFSLVPSWSAISLETESVEDQTVGQ